jgi:hypothetical protein
MLTAVESPVRILVVSAEPWTSPGHWTVRWQVANRLAESVVLEDAWVPHGRFRGEGHVALGETVAARGITTVQLRVTSNEPHGTFVENAFLILRVRAGQHGWRVFARMRVEFSASGMAPVVEAVTAQPLH